MITIAEGQAYTNRLRALIAKGIEPYALGAFAKNLVPQALDLIDLLYQRIEALRQETKNLETLYTDLLLDSRYRVDDDYTGDEPPPPNDGDYIA